MKRYSPPTRQPQKILAVLVLTSILSLGVGSTLLNAATASVVSPQRSENVNRAKQPRNRRLPPAVLNAVREDLSNRTGIARGQLRLVSSNPETWPDTCLGLARPDEFCGEMLVEGWRVVMSDGRQTWVYRTDSNGKMVRVQPENADNLSTTLPSSTAKAVLQAASQRTGLPISNLQIVEAKRQLWPDGCLGLGGAADACLAAIVPGWQVIVEGNQQRLVYRTDESGSQVKLDEAASSIGNANLPKVVGERVLQLASELLKIPTDQLRITKQESQTWNNSCLDLQRPEERCMGVLTPGWRVTVEAKGQRLVYHTDSEGSRIRLNQEASSISSTLPDAIAKAVLQDASTQLNVSSSRIRVVRAEMRDWPDSCLGIPDPLALCNPVIVSGWQVRVEGKGQSLVYRTNDSGSLIKLERTPTQTNNGAVPIPQSELPPPLAPREVFRAITSGGIAGISYQITLMNDGQVIRVQLSPNTPAQPETHQISRQQLRQFQQVLAQQKFVQFNQLAFPAPPGSADYFTVTLTSKAGTTRYADIGQTELPESLQSVIKAWAQIASN